MKTEQNYDFRRELLTIHEANIRKANRKPKGKEYWVADGAKIGISPDAPEVIAVAAADFADFLTVSMNLSGVTVTEGDADITIRLAAKIGVDLGEFGAYKGFRVETTETGITITAHDDRGAAQALYYIEDLMTFAGAPCVAYGKIEKRAMYTPQMVHSAYGMDEFPDEYLARVAHEGRDAILVFTKGANQANDFPLDFNDLIRRAARYGIDVYAYSKMKSEVHPLDEGAEEFYEKLYGTLFRECPGLKGVTLVGESIGIPSKDPRVGGPGIDPIQGIPQGYPAASAFPCLDYADFLELLKRVIRKYKPDADIVFWTYNWGSADREARMQLLEKIPTDITLLATFEMCEPLRRGNSVLKVADYSLTFEGPGQYFVSEAEVAKRRGIRMYSMTNSGGRTWDFGCAHYEPMPYQWMRRYEAMGKAHDELGLVGIMEGHHYGFYPSMISKLSKHLFMIPTPKGEEVLAAILGAEYGEENVAAVDAALRDYSEAIRYYTPTVSDQYGAFRVGPTQSLNLLQVMHLPFDPGASYGHANWRAEYLDVFHKNSLTKVTPLAIRIHDEIASLETMLALMESGTQKLQAIQNPNEKLMRLINLGHFLTNTVKTAIAAKRMYCLRIKLLDTADPEQYGGILDQIEALLLKERENVLDTIPLVERDSALGFEPSMLYITDKKRLEWKLLQLKFVLTVEMREMREGLSLHRQKLEENA